MNTVIKAFGEATGWEVDLTIHTGSHDTKYFYFDDGAGKCRQYIDLDFCNTLLQLEKKVVCEYCGGAGKIPMSCEDVKCDDCGGDGEVSVPLIPNKEYTDALQDEVLSYTPASTELYKWGEVFLISCAKVEERILAITTVLEEG